MSGPIRSILPVAAILLILVIVAVAVAILSGPGDAETYPADSPQGVVQRYIQALQDRDVERAYDYLSTEIQEETPLEDFRQMTRFASTTDDMRRIRLERVGTDGDRATVHLTYERLIDDGLDFNRYSYQRQVPLVRENGDWKIDDLVTDLAVLDGFHRIG